MIFWYLILIIVVAYFFDFLNGFHDAANSISTVVSTRVLSPFLAVLLAALFNFVAFSLFGFSVAKTVGSGIVNPGAIDQDVVFSALLGAITWDILTWYFGLPTSSSHALIGGLVGSGVAKAGITALHFSGLTVVIAFMVLSPVIGFVISFTLMAFMIHLFHSKSASSVNRYFRRFQLISSSLVSLSHGTNDAQKTMGIVTVLLFVSGNLKSFEVPFWVALLAAFSIALGTFFGGWRIVRTLGFRLTRLDPLHGFAIETSAATTIMMSSIFGIPVSTTHCVSGSVLGAGATMGTSAVKWGIARNIVWAWLLTIPVSALISALSYSLVSSLTQ